MYLPITEEQNMNMVHVSSPKNQQQATFLY